MVVIMHRSKNVCGDLVGNVWLVGSCCVGSQST